MKQRPQSAKDTVLSQLSFLTPWPTGATDAATQPLGLRRVTISLYCCYEVIKQNCARRPEVKQRQTKDLSVGTPNDESLPRERLPEKISQIPSTRQCFTH